MSYVRSASDAGKPSIRERSLASSGPRSSRRRGPSKVPRTSLRTLKPCACDLNKNVIDVVRTPSFPSLTMFAWPRCKKKGKSERLTVEHGWSCNSCGRALRGRREAKKHAKGPCVPASEALCAKYERELQNLRKWANAPGRTALPPQIQDLITSALKAVRRQQQLPCS